MKIKLKVTGMTCAACAARVEKAAKSVQNVSNVDVNLLAGTLTADILTQNQTDSIIQAVQKAGYVASVPGQTDISAPIDNDTKKIKHRIILSFSFLIILMYLTMGHMLGLPLPAWYQNDQSALLRAMLQFLLTLPVVVMNRSYYTKGLMAFLHCAPNMDSLIAVGSGAALVSGVFALLRMCYAVGYGDLNTVMHYSHNLYFESAAMILTLITFGKFLEARAKGKTTDAIRQLMDLKPKTATVLIDGLEQDVPVDHVKIGDIVVVRSGGSIPVDGIVVNGRGSVNQSALTGESVPVEKSVGDAVCAATTNTEGYLQIRAEKVGDDTTLSQIIRLVEESGGSKAPIARLADKVAGVFVPVVMSISVVAFTVWLILGQTFEFALTTGISVLVISCPCALGLATPVAIMVATGQGAKLGILFKNAEALESLHNVDTVVFDKTGTLTVGQPSVTDVIVCHGDKDTLLCIARSLEIPSEHPFAKAVVGYTEHIAEKQTTEFETIPGQGVSACIDGVRYLGGNQRLMETYGIAVPEYSEYRKIGKTPLYFASCDGVLIGVIVTADILKPESSEAVKQLRSLGLDVVMLTGDNEATAKAIAYGAGITHIVSDVLPTEKAKEVESIRSGGRKVMMVGDGINDAPALVSADVGMAIGAGTDVAIESASVVLMRDSLFGVCDAIALSKATLRNIKQNLFWAFFYNAIGIPVAAGVLYPAFGIQLSPMLGAAAMSLSSFFVVSNALRLRLFHAKFVQPLRESKGVNVSIQEETVMEKVIHVEGMMCPHCQARVESVCKAIAGVQNAVVDLKKKQVTVTGDMSEEAVIQAIQNAGYEVVQ